MLLIGQYDSPFVRRVGVALHLYAMAFEHKPWSVFRDAEKIAQYNPLLRVPTLVLDDGEALIESAAILDYLDEVADPSKRLIPANGADRRRSLKTCAVATGIADKAVSLIYEKVLHLEPSPVWIDRCLRQIVVALDLLEAERRPTSTPFWSGPSIGHADIATTCAIRFLRDAHPDNFGAWRWPTLAMHAAHCEALPPFRDIAQPFIPPR